MASGRINLQANDGKVAGIVFEDGASGDVAVTVPKDGGKLVVDGTVVHNTGDEAIAGVKTFSSNPIVPTPTAGNHAVSKDYVDNGPGANFVANDQRVKTAINASGEAPIYACRAWVNFNGTGTVAIRASGNVSSITDNGTGDYTINFITVMPDANYTLSTCSLQSSGNIAVDVCKNTGRTDTASLVNICSQQGAARVDVTNLFLSIFR